MVSTPCNVLFIIDTSDSVAKEFNDQVEFGKEVIQGMDLQSQSVGVMLFSSIYYQEVRLTYISGGYRIFSRGGAHEQMFPNFQNT